MSENVIIGVGQTGLACVAYWQGLGESVCVMDTREKPPMLADLQAQFPDVDCVLGRIDIKRCEAAKQVVMSPGLGLDHPAAKRLQDAKVSWCSDIDLFLEQVTVPVIGVTGSNGKSTVVSLVAACCEKAGMRTLLCGNIGRPVLSCLDGQAFDVVVLELSSFQCEYTRNLRLHAASIVNISPDHMDWHGSMEAYVQAKRRVIAAAKYYVANRDDEQTQAPSAETTFGLGAPSEKGWGMVDGSLVYGNQQVVACSDLLLWGQHQWLNVMAACALAQTVGVTLDQCREACQQFKGLPHRCQRVAVTDEVAWYNDSKGTNPGATRAALSAVMQRTDGAVIAILGGLGKEAPFGLLDDVLAKAKHVLVYGKDAAAIQAALPTIGMERVAGVPEAVTRAATLAEPGDAVCFSPACASWDQYEHYRERGDHFEQCVRDLS